MHAQLKLLLIGSAEQVDRQAKKDNILESTAQPYKSFSESFKSLDKQDRQSARASALDLLWSFFPCCQDLEGYVGNAEHPGDGYIYDSDRVTKAKSVLQDLHLAWKNMEDWQKCPPPPTLPEMGQICLILTGMQRQHLLEFFLDRSIVDGNLPLEKKEIEEVLNGDHANYALTFFTEQYRAVPRQWDEGDHLTLEEEEPLPLLWEQEYNRGSYGAVDKVRDKFSGETYAQKKQLIDKENEQENAATRKHLEGEIERLRVLRHKHIVQFVKSYERGEDYGFLLRPAANYSLERLIERYYRNKFSFHEDCDDREWLRPVFMIVFGCLSRGLAYIHAHNIRHKDVKTANILLERAEKNIDRTRVLWADFGLAYDFSATKNSKTRSKEMYSQRYAAPEILAVNRGPVTDKRGSIYSLGSIPQNGEEMRIDAKIESDFQEDELTGHGRKTDIFSLGCVFLEILGALVDSRLPLDEQTPKDPQRTSKERPEDHANGAPKDVPNKTPMFCKYIPELTAWAQGHQQNDQKRELTPLFQLAVKMIRADPRERPEINDVVRDIVAASGEHFCESCWLECEEHQKPSAPKSANQHTHVANPSSPRSSSNMLRKVNSALSVSSQTAQPLFARLST